MSRSVSDRPPDSDDDWMPGRCGESESSDEGEDAIVAAHVEVAVVAAHAEVAVVGAHAEVAIVAGPKTCRASRWTVHVPAPKQRSRTDEIIAAARMRSAKGQIHSARRHWATAKVAKDCLQVA